MVNLVEHKKITFIIPLLIILAGIISLIIFGGFSLDVDFAGGTEIMVNFKTTIDKAELTTLFKDKVGFEPSAIQISLSDSKIATIKSKHLTNEQSENLWNSLKEKYNLDDKDRLSVSSVEPTIGKELSKTAVISVIIAIILMLLYITVRFEFLSGLSAIVALIHDVLIVLSVYAITRIPLNTSFIATILTIVGYSINDTIVVFDRVRENYKFAKKETFREVAGKSINQTIVRSINTSVTTLITIVLLYILGPESIKQFSLALTIGVLAGTYSSIFVATPVWVALREGTKKKRV